MATAPHMLIIGMGPRLGLAAARRFGRGGHRIGMIARSSSRLGRHVQDLAGEGIDAQYAVADVADPDGLRDAIDKLVIGAGTPSVVLYNAAEHAVGRAATVSHDAVARAIAVSALGALTALQALLPSMRARRSGSLLFTGTASALDPGPHDVVDAAAKAALRAIVLSAARDHERDGLHLAMLTLNGEPRPGTPFEPARIAESLWALSREPSGAWTRERVYSGQPL
jgi:NAD(P)-dependent dehydrogenase (short-subunit alcohol dehydrogenase family)